MFKRWRDQRRKTKEQEAREFEKALWKATEEVERLNQQTPEVFCPLLDRTCTRSCVCWEPAKVQHGAFIEEICGQPVMVLRPRCSYFNRSL